MFIKIARSTLLMGTLHLASASFAGAQTYLPPGCFVTDAERSLYVTPPTCYNEARATIISYSPDHGFSAEEIYDLYGFQFGREAINSWDLFYKWKKSESNSTKHYSWYSAEFNKNKKLKALERKLRKACGSKCRTIATISSLSSKTVRPRTRQEGENESIQPGTKFEDYILSQNER
jgi:hypothetical protein